ncbi:MAG TPA: trypsin-like serine protease [Polyangiaceae bacterium]|nr:trypsin-like serine protease [Polyangiaceae bacterium]
MRRPPPLPTRKALRIPIGLAALGSATALASAVLAGCAGSEGRDTNTDDTIASREAALIGGRPAASDQFRSSVGFGGVCTAAKVGPRLFLTAAHCVAVPRPGRFDPVPDPFPPNDGVADRYLAGSRLLIQWGLDVDDPEQAEFTITRTSIHPSWWECPLCQEPSRNAAADIAVVEIAEDTPDIPEARVELDSIPVGTPVVEVGWGCELTTNPPPGTSVELDRFKLDDAVTIVATEIQRHEPRIGDEQRDRIDASYLITAGHDQSPDDASLCLGDSGGPLYLADSSDPRVVGVNSDYTFRGDQPEPGGVSWTDWHTRTSLASLHGVGQWLLDQGVDTVGGG